MTSCVFCRRIAMNEYDRKELSCVVFEPLNPVVEGHLLVVPIFHSDSAADSYDSVIDAGRALELAAIIIMENGIEANIITSIGESATQSIKHTHIHIVPRKPGDGLLLPWTGQLPLNPCGKWLDGHSYLKCRRPEGHEGECHLNNQMTRVSRS